MTQEQIEKFKKLATSTNALARETALNKLREAGVDISDIESGEAKKPSEPKEPKQKIKLPKREKESKKDKEEEKEKPRKLKFTGVKKRETEEGEPSCDELLDEWHKKEKEKLQRAKEKKDKPKPTAKTIVKHKVESVTGIISRQVKQASKSGKISEEETESVENLISEIEENAKTLFANMQDYARKGETKKLSKINTLMRNIANV